MKAKSAIYIWYVRVSSQEQAARKLSIPSQIEQIKNYARQNEFIIESIYEEKQSAFKWKRPQFNSMISHIKANKRITWIIIFKYDRLSRNIDDFAVIDKLVRNRDLEIVSVTEPMFNSYLWRYMLRDMQNRAILYSEELSFRVKLWIRKRLQLWNWRGWVPPFWFDVVKWYYIPNKEKAPIVQYIFSQYATGLYGAKTIASQVRNKFWLMKFWHKRIETMLWNTMYIWRERVKRKLSNAEYMFWWVDKPWVYYEEYDSKFITPIVSEDDFERCQDIRKKRWSIYPKTSWKARYPKIFVCSCWRNLRRDDKKNIKYLSCPKHINNKHMLKCNESYIQLDSLNEEIILILRNVIHTYDERSAMKQAVEKKLLQDNESSKEEQYYHLENINKLVQKLDVLTDSFIDWDIEKATYWRSSKKIQEKIKISEWELKVLESNSEYVVAWKKVIQFFSILDQRDDIISRSFFYKKSSQPFSLFFKCIANLSLKGWKPYSYRYYQPFNILQNVWMSEWWVTWDSNPGPWA